MRKLRLELDDLQVSSFPTAGAVSSEGTVLACQEVVEVPDDTERVELANTGTPCMWSAGCPLNSFSCFCFTGNLPNL